MRVALVNPNWTFDGSIYFGCRHPHLPIEFGFTQATLEAAGHDVLLIDAHLFDIDPATVAAEVRSFGADMAVVATAPTYLFWRCAPPELRVPQEFAFALREAVATLVVCGPHGSTTPRPVLRKLGADIVVMGECEETVAHIARGHSEIAGTCVFDGNEAVVRGGSQAAAFVDRAPLHWPKSFISRHRHHHHRFDAEPAGPGAEVEASRGCPYSCTFCATIDFRDKYRRRPVPVIEAEVTHLEAQGVEYVYFIDEIFLPDRVLLNALCRRSVRFGIQTRIDLWKPDMLELLGRAGCVSIEAGVESLSPDGRARLDKRCRMSTEDLALRLIEAKRHIPFVQANLIETTEDEPHVVARWRKSMREAGVWANDPVPMFPYPGAPDYRALWGEPDDEAWERAVDYYISKFPSFSELQEVRPRRLADLELEQP